MASLTVHHLDNSRSQRVLWLLEELEAPYALELHRRDPVTMRAPAALRELHPLGKAPVVVLEDGTVLAESGAILETLVDLYGQGRMRPAPGTEAHRRYRFFMHYAEGSLMPPLLVRFIVERLRTAPLPFFVRPLVKGIAGKIDGAFTMPEIARHAAFLEGELEGRAWLVGDDEPTAADVQMSFPLEALLGRAGGGASMPRITALVERMRARPAFQRALARGGPYDLRLG
jgi:glutathione S-transferase